LPHYSPDELQAAWAEVRGADWPTVPELLQHQARLHQVRAAAQRRRDAQYGKGSSNGSGSSRPTPPPLHRTPPRQPAHSHAHDPLPVQLDRKRAAAGERMDDDDAT